MSGTGARGSNAGQNTGALRQRLPHAANIFPLPIRTGTLSRQMHAVEKLLRELIALPSVNPAFMPKGDPRAGEGRVADFLISTAAAGGLDVASRPVFPGRANVLATLTPQTRASARFARAAHGYGRKRGDVGKIVSPNIKRRPAVWTRRVRYERFHRCDAHGFAQRGAKPVTPAGDRDHPRRTGG